MFYIVTPFSCLILHFYNEEKGESNRVFNLLCYPLMLLAVGIAMCAVGTIIIFLTINKTDFE